MPNLEKESQSQSAPDDAGQLSYDDAAKLVQQRLESLRGAGLTHLPKGNGDYAVELVRESQADFKTDSGPKSTKATQPAPSNKTPATTTGPSSPPSTSAINQDGNTQEASAGSVTATPTKSPEISDGYGPSLPAAERDGALKVLQEEVARCTRCDELASTRSQTVFGVGSASTRLVLLGEGPGAEEDRLGEPFVGAAGQLLDKIIAACKLSRSDVYILNTVKCRPPSNRNPGQSELANCWGYAERQLEIIQPEFICCLGSVAARTLLKTTLSIGKLRRQLHCYRGSRVLVTYHPAYLLRTPSAKKHVWEDMQFLMKEMGIELSR